MHMKQSNAFLAVTVLIGFLVLFIYGTTVIDIGGKDTAEKDETNRLTVLENPTVDFADPMLGPRDAKLTIVEFGNFMCLACGELNPTLKNILAKFPGDIRLVWKDVADDSTQMGAGEASMAARCAWQQGAFWEYHDLLMNNQGRLIATNFTPLAAEIGLDIEEFETCLSQRITLPLIERTTEEALRLRLTAVPTLFIGDRRVEGQLTESQLTALIQIELDKLAQNEAATAEPAAAR